MFQSRRSARLAPAFFAVEPRQFDVQLQPPRSKLAEPAVVLQLFLKRGDLLRPHVPGVTFAQVAVAELTVLAAAGALLGGKASRVHAPEPTRLRRISYAVFCLKKKNKKYNKPLHSPHLLLK